MRAALIIAMSILMTGSPMRADSLVLDHATLEAKAQKARAQITYASECVVVRTRVKYAWVWWPVRVEAVFVSEAGHVRLKATRLVVSGKNMPQRLREADARVAKLVDVESSADVVEIYQGSEVVYKQVLDSADAGK